MARKNVLKIGKWKGIFFSVSSGHPTYNKQAVCLPTDFFRYVIKVFIKYRAISQAIIYSIAASKLRARIRFNAFINFIERQAMSALLKPNQQLLPG